MKHLKHLFTVLLLLCCIGTAKAEEVTIDGIKYDVVTKAKLATVIEGDNYSYSGDIVIPSEITHNDVICSVTSIGSYAFSYSSGLTSITIPNSVTFIGDNAFYYCTGLKNVVIGDGVTSIGNYAFRYCTGLTSITIANSVKSIGESAFSECYKLTSITIANSVTSIGDHAFAYCSGLKEVHINDLAAWCGIDFGANPLYYAKNLYLNGELVTELVIPDGVKEIKNYAFEGCTSLTSIEIPNSVTSIGRSAFLGCSGLTSITIPNSVTSIGEWAFSGCTGLTSIEIPNSVTSIEAYAFNYCTCLTSIEIPNSVTSIGGSAFSGCTGLTSIEIPNSVTSIEAYAFEGCSGLTSVTIGTGVKNIGSKAFAKCSNLTDVYCLTTSVPSAESNAFNESYPEYMTLHVPEEAIESYRTTAPWSSFGTVVTLDGEDIIEPEVKICAMPTVSYSDCKLHFECETEGAEFVTEITSSDFNKFYNNDINLTATYNISVYATATGYENSDIVNATLCWIECECDGGDTGIINIPAKAVLVTSSNGTISINCSLDGESVAVYTTGGTLIATTTIENGTATVATGLSKGSVAIVNIAGKSIKVAVN